MISNKRLETGTYSTFSATCICEAKQLRGIADLALFGMCSDFISFDTSKKP